MKQSFSNQLRQISRQIFYNEFGRVRSGWRAVIFLLAFSLFAGFFGGLINLLLLDFNFESDKNTFWHFVFPNAILLVFSLFVGWLCGKFLENVPFRALGCWFTKNWLKNLLLGSGLGTITILLAALIGAAFGGLKIEPNAASGSTAIWLTLGISLIVFTLGAAAEEAFFRGYVLQTFARAKLAWFAIAATSLFFASGHLGNPNANYFSTLNTMLAGVWFSIAYLKTRDLWMVFGLHLMWNWVQGAILGLPVSGITELTTAPFFRMTDSGSAVLTGGNYGIEGGLASTIAIILSGVLIWFLPIFKPSEEMITLTSEEIPVRTIV